MARDLHNFGGDIPPILSTPFITKAADRHKMKNPWKQQSKISPQADNGTRRVASDVYVALIMAPLTAVEHKVCEVIIHKTWGFGKVADAISVRQFMDLIPASDRAIQKAQKRLKDLQIIHFEPSSKGNSSSPLNGTSRGNCGSPLNLFLLNKYYDTWAVWNEAGIEIETVLKACGQFVGKGDLRGKNTAAKGELYGQTRVNCSSPTIETIQKKHTIAAHDFEKSLTEQLGSIATLQNVIKVLSETKPKLWWRVEKYLRQTYPGNNSGERTYAEAAGIVIAREREGVTAA